MRKTIHTLFSALCLQEIRLLSPTAPVVPPSPLNIGLSEIAVFRSR